jgi:hypothetical protein
VNTVIVEVTGVSLHRCIVEFGTLSAQTAVQETAASIVLTIKDLH